MLERLLLFTVFLPFFKLPPPPGVILKKKLSVCGGRGVFSQREHHLNWGWGGVGGGVLISEMIQKNISVVTESNFQRSCT